MNRLKMMQVLIISVLLCGFLATPAMSGTVPAGKRINLVAGGSQNGTFPTQYLNITYDYTFGKNQLTLAGKLKFADSFTTMNSAGLQHFYMEVLLLDAKGEIIDRKNVVLKTAFSWGDDEALAAKSFKAQLTIPAQTKAITFYYSGLTQASPSGQGTSFWYDPSSGLSK